MDGAINPEYIKTVYIPFVMNLYNCAGCGGEKVRTDRGISAAPPPHPVFLRLCHFTNSTDAIHRLGEEIVQWTIINYYHTM